MVLESVMTVNNLFTIFLFGPYHFFSVYILMKAVQDFLDVQRRIFLALILPVWWLVFAHFLTKLDLF